MGALLLLQQEMLGVMTGLLYSSHMHWTSLSFIRTLAIVTGTATLTRVWLFPAAVLRPGTELLH